ncbi:DNA polymerase IV (DinB-like DNA polymerase) [Natronoarchaeum philippinense]|uniref:DNA polymerase IV n=1 Tax=Natronoarchaeum philippinense TaxID=558529 RepID=A0A285N449_NATPI|nr:DNA polymerase IV [Natronoarchaeum philippinense]SNZ04098.1 DNA polymerase IV (DinB-like DNA polymerase) [Natronoarchaeum philippinense]
MTDRGDGTLPGVDGGAPDQIVLHVDMDCFYAACERLREPELEGEPLVVGMGYEPGDDIGAVATASYEAREHGVESAQAISTALERLPRKADPDNGDPAGYYRPVDLDYYSEIAAEVKAILHDCADVVREVSIDEAYLDVTDRTGWSVAEGFARHVKNRIEREVGVVASVGVAPTLSAAKVASDRDKPDGLVVVEPGEVADFFAPLDIEAVHGVGPVTARELREMGIETAGDLAAADPHELESRFGERGRELYDRARGADDRAVTPTGDPKSLSRESAFAEAVEDADRKRDQLRALAEAVADRASREGAQYRTIGVKAVTPPYDINTRERSLPGPVEDADLVEEIALELFAEFDDEPVRKVGVRLSNLSFAGGEQARLTGWDGVDRSGAEDQQATVDADGPAADAPVDDAETATDEDAEVQDANGPNTAGQSSLADF